MNRLFFKMFAFFVIAGAILNLCGVQQISLNINGNTTALSLLVSMAYLFALFITYEALIIIFSVAVKMLKNDVLLSNHAFEKDVDIIELNKTENENKIVLNRNQLDEMAILIVNAMASISSNALNNARRHLVNLRKIIGNDAIIDIFMLKIYKKEKNFDKIEEVSKKLMQNENIQLIGMKAALEVQLEKKEFTEALKTVNQAFEVRQDLYWVVANAFLLRAKNEDWSGALEVLNSSIEKNIVPVKKALRLKSVALFQLAMQAKENGDDVKFYKFISQAIEINPRFIPASLELANYYILNDRQIRKAEKVLTSIWHENPSYEVAKAYMNLFENDSKEEKIERMERFALLNSKRPSLNNLILAELYIEAGKKAKANTECKLFLLKNPATEKMHQILAMLENKKSGKTKEKGLVSSIKLHFTTEKESTQNCYPKDFQWVCANCNHSSDKWQAICPECGEIGRHYWHLYLDEADSDFDFDE